MLPYSAIVGVVAGTIVSLAIFVVFIWFCKSQSKSFSNKNSETGSSDPSALTEWNRGGGSSSATGQTQRGRKFRMEELEQATRQFGDGNLIGYGSFGLVYKGLLRDTVVAIKRRHGAPLDDFVAEVSYLSEIRHRNLVSLLGYCQEGGFQLLVFEYVPNGSICNHLLNDSALESSTKLEFKQRLSIALGAAKGLRHLHSLNPLVVHQNFKTANVLVDENFIVKVADAGIFKLLENIEEAGPSQISGVNAYKDPEAGASGIFTAMSDVYSFGVFLLELITGQQAKNIESLGSQETLIQWVARRLSSNNFVDKRLNGSFTREGIRDLIKLALRCMSFPGEGRPKMEMVVLELERIQEKEMAMTMVMGEGTSTIIKGSELFASE